MSLADCTVMVVEDHEFQRRTTLQILANLGAGGLLEAADGEGALALIAGDERPDIVICDLDMPGMDGVEFLRHVAALGDGTAIVIASGLDESVLRSAELTARGYGLEVLGAIGKPLTARKLLQAVGLHRPQSAAPVPVEAAEAAADPWAAALRDGQVGVSLRPRVELASGRLGALEVRAHRASPPGEAAVDAATDPLGPAPGATATAVAERLARDGVAAMRACAGAGEHVEITLVVPPSVLADAQVLERLAALAAGADVELPRICVALPDARDAPPAAAPLDLLTRLRVRGFGLGIDGFGAARATLPELGRIPLTEVKIAAAAVARATTSQRGAEAFGATVQALRDQGLDVVCDGCDAQPEWELALQSGCRRAQGALIGPAMTLEELPGWLARRGAVA